MDRFDHDFDPEGDLILLLSPVRDGCISPKFHDLKGLMEEPSHSENGALGPNSKADGLTLTTETSHLVGCARTQSEAASDVAGDEVDSADRSLTTLRVRVSSKHLALASRTLKLLLPSGPEWPLLDHEPNALLVLLKLIHGRNWDVPRQLDLTTLTEISILVDHYDLRETVSMMAECWRSNIDFRRPHTFDKEILQWMCVSWVFDWREIWNEVTRVAKLHCFSLICETRLPIPKLALGK
jgi:hypothetical protein